jgi:endonuclease/exonuclease/phosphatase family metal-dependent hydrolase
MRFRGSRLPTLVRDEPRVAVAAEIDSPLGLLTVVNTHLTFLGRWNRRQLRRLLRTVEAAPRPLVLVGDLNMGPGPAGGVTGLRALASHTTFPWDDPREQLDHVLADGPVRARSSSAPPMPLSDHRPLVVDLEPA